MKHGSRFAGSRSDPQPLSLGVFTLVLLLSLWLAIGSVVLAAAAGGPHPTRRLIIGVLLVSVTAVALRWRRAVCAWLGTRPWLVLPLALVQLAAAVVDGLFASGPYLAFSASSLALAVVVARPRTVWLTVVALELSYAAAVLVQRSPAQLAADDKLAGVLGAMLRFPFAALVGLGIVRLYSRFMADVPRRLEAMRDGAPTLTPALSFAIASGRGALAQLPAPAPAAQLTATERRVVEGLAAGSTPKELAFRWGVSIATVRTHVRRAKRKTSARTLSELAGMPGRSGWPDPVDHDT